MTLRELKEKLDVPHKVALRLAPMIPGAKKEAATPGQIPGWVFPDDAPDHITEEMLQAARASLRDDPALPAELREESQGVREAREASELADARRRQIEAEEQLADTERKRQARRRTEEVERRTHRLRLRELASTRDALLEEIRHLEQRLVALHQEFERRLAALDQESATGEEHVQTLRRTVEAETQTAAEARARCMDVEAELAATQSELATTRSSLATVVADLRAARDERAALKAECDGYVAIAREQVAAIEAEEADWRAATRAFVALWRGPVAGQMIRTLMTLSDTLAAAGLMDEAAALAELRRRLFRFFVPALGEIAALLDRQDLSDKERVVEARKLVVRVREQQRKEGDLTG